MEQSRKLLLVDDEGNILAALKRLLRRDGYTILSASSGAEGLKLLQEYPDIGVILSDQRMPEMTGTEFLGKVKALYPDTVRIVLSGYTDLNSVTDAINEGAIYKFLTKPWDDELLRKNVCDAFEYHELKLKNQRLTKELSLANEKLEQKVAEKTKDASFNLTVLQQAQDVLEYLPVAVIGVAKDGMVVVANRLAGEWLAGMLFLGQDVQTALPEAITTIYRAAIDGNAGVIQRVMLAAEHEVNVQCVPLGNVAKPRGWTIVMNSIEEGAEHYG
jgi:response regulator RpfG family c-di-GMP phosphodiesterase